MKSNIKNLFITIFILSGCYFKPLFATKPILIKHLSGGPVVIFEENKFVDYVNIYLLIDKTPFKDNMFIDNFVRGMEISLRDQGAICQPLINRTIPESPFDANQQSFLIIRFSVDDFENNISSILQTLLFLKQEAKYLIYDKNIIYQKMQKELKFLQPDTLLNTFKQIENAKTAPVTLHQHMYLLFSGKINVFKILNTLSNFVANKTLPEKKITRNKGEQLYWLFVFQRFLIDILKNKTKFDKAGCIRILAPINIEQGKINVKINNLSPLSRGSLFKQISDHKTIFKDWYLKDYLNYFNWVEFDHETKILLRLYSECYLGNDVLFRLHFNPDNKLVDQFFEEPEKFIEFK